MSVQSKSRSLATAKSAGRSVPTLSQAFAQQLRSMRPKRLVIQNRTRNSLNTRLFNPQSCTLNRTCAVKNRRKKGDTYTYTVTSISTCSDYARALLSLSVPLVRDKCLLQHVTHTHTDWDKAMHFQRYRLRGPHTQTHTPHTHKKPAKLCTLLMLDWLGKTLRKVCRNSVALSGRLGNATPKRKALWTNTLLDRVKAPAQHQWNRACAKARSTSRRARAAVT